MTTATPSSRPRTGGPRRGAPGPGPRSGRLPAALLCALLAGTVACGQYAGGEESASGATSSGTPPPPPPGGSGTGTDSISAFGVTVYPLLRDNCIACHAGAGPGTPAIAHSDVTTAHDAVVNNQKVNLGSPMSSRLVERLVADFHYCWTDCVSDGATMQAAIEQWAALINFSGGGTNVSGGIASSALSLADGVEDDGDRRYRDRQIALWEFKEGSGPMAFDTSGVAPAMNISLIGPTWVSGQGIDVQTGRAEATRQASRKLYDYIANPQGGSNQYSVEAWLTPASVALEGPARIINYSNGTSSRNFGLGQVLYTYDFRNRSVDAEINGNGDPSLRTYDADRDLQDTLQHVVLTYDPYRGRRIYVNGTFTDDVDERNGAALFNWDPNYIFVLGNETTNNRQWMGKIHMVAIFDRVLTDAQIRQNFEAGVGKRILMAFDLSQWTGPGTALELTVSEYDDYSYLFCQPTFRGGNPTNVRVKNMRVLVNGQAPASGQAFVNVDTVVTSAGQELSRQCSIVPKDQGAGADVFAIEFEILGGFQNLVVQGPPPPLPGDVFGDPMPDTGIRDFEKISDTMAAVTGVDPNTPAVATTFDELRQQLPGGFDVRSFVSSHQVGIAKLALEYCDALVESPTLRDAFFGTAPRFEFDSPVATAFSTQAKRDLVVDRLLNGMQGTNLASQPSRAEAQPLLDTLISDLTAACAATPCDAERTQTVVKAACAAVLSSAAVTLL